MKLTKKIIKRNMANCMSEDERQIMNKLNSFKLSRENFLNKKAGFIFEVKKIISDLGISKIEISRMMGKDDSFVKKTFYSGRIISDKNIILLAETLNYHDLKGMDSFPELFASSLISEKRNFLASNQ